MISGLTLGTLGAISTDAWPLAWLLIEINLMSFIPLISKKWTAKKNTLLYFIAQRLGSLSLFAGGVLGDEQTMPTKCILLGLMLKTRMAPLHFWGAVVISSLIPLYALVFLTWQKIVPLCLLFITVNKYLLFWVVVVNILVGSFCVIGSKDILILIFFSGLIHIGWILAGRFILAMKYLIFYSISTAPIVLSFGNLPLLLMNIAGLPPITGFLIKMRMLQLTDTRMGLFLLLTSSFPLFTYLRYYLIKPYNWRKIERSTFVVCSVGLIFYR